MTSEQRAISAYIHYTTCLHKLPQFDDDFEIDHAFIHASHQGPLPAGVRASSVYKCIHVILSKTRSPTHATKPQRARPIKRRSVVAVVLSLASPRKIAVAALAMQPRNVNTMHAA